MTKEETENLVKDVFTILTKEVNMEKNHCIDCGKAIGKYATRCKTHDKLYFDQLHEKAVAIVATRKCPQCGSGLKRNIAMAGWWQCEQFGAEQFRKDPSKQACSFQIFTE